MKDPIEKLESFRELKPGWNSYGAPVISEASIEAAKAFLRLAQPVPTSLGGVQIEWHLKEADIELVFNAKGELVGFAGIFNERP